MQNAASVRAKPHNIARIGWDFRFKEDDIEHGRDRKMAG
jgi:hypothetical protein